MGVIKRFGKVLRPDPFPEGRGLRMNGRHLIQLLKPPHMQLFLGWSLETVAYIEARSQTWGPAGEHAGPPALARRCFPPV